MTLHRKNKALRKTRVARKKKANKRASKKGRGVYDNECLIPVPDKEGEDFDDRDPVNRQSCKAVDLNDDYGDSELPPSANGKKECNMYYYLYKDNYYRCRKYRGNKCNKTGKFGFGRKKCGANALARLREQDVQVESELDLLVNPLPISGTHSPIRLPAVPASNKSQLVLPSVPKGSIKPGSLTRNINPSGSSRGSPSRSKVQSPPRTLRVPPSSNRTRKAPMANRSLVVKEINPAIRQIDSTIQKLRDSIQEKIEEKKKLQDQMSSTRITENAKRRTRSIIRQIDRMNLTNLKMIKRFERQREVLASRL